MGFLGLIAILVLLIIYLLKPQYKQKHVSGTIVWRRAVSHSKKQRPVMSNFIIFLVQALVLSIIAAGFAEPRLYSKTSVVSGSEYVFVLDASASMRAKSLDGGKTRFDRAVESVKNEINKFFNETDDGSVSLIVASSEPTYAFSDMKKSSKDEVFAMLGSLSCSLKEGNFEDALKLADSRLGSNPYTKIFLYTDTKMASLGSAVEVVNVADKSSEKNIAILGCNVGITDNEYAFELVLGAYGDIVQKCEVFVDITGASNGKEPFDVHLTVPVEFATSENSSFEQVKRVSVRATDEEYGGKAEWLFDTYDEMKISLNNNEDSIADDDTYFVYGGLRDSIKIEYWSNDPNSFWQIGFNNLANNMKDSRAITFHEIYEDQGMEAENSGYDFYIFEHSIPSEILANGMPKDGVVILIDPDETISSANLGISYKKRVSLGALTTCTGKVHELTRYLNFDRIGMTEYSQFNFSDDTDFEPLMRVGADAALLLRNRPDSKCVVMPFSINMSNFFADQFQIFVYNLINYFMPLTVSNTDFELGEKSEFSCKGESIDIGHNGESVTLTDFPSEFTFNETGTYTLTTKFGLEKEPEVKKVYVHVSTDESNIFAESDLKVILSGQEIFDESGRDFFIWLAVASIILILIEWILQFKYIL